MNSKTSSTEPHSAYLWPDHTIGKRESRALRDSHNALYNDYHNLLAVNAELVRALESIAKTQRADGEWESLVYKSKDTARAALRKAKGE